MKPRNLLSVFQGEKAIIKSGISIDKQFKSLKEHEIYNMQSFCEIMKLNGCKVEHYDGFFVGYTIAQLGKEFDLLRFGKDCVLNIEIKSRLKDEMKEQKLLSQMRKNHYYLKFLGKPIILITYVENDGFYRLNSNHTGIKKTREDVVARVMIKQAVDYSIDPDKEFIPSNYLISPFNATSSFINGEYFLTSAQEKIKDEIKKELGECPFMFFCISANAGTGKTLLMYDIAKEQIRYGKKVKVIHCGILNEGHKKLQDDYGWDIISISEIKYNKNNVMAGKYDYMLIDESQRIRVHQLKQLIEKSIIEKVPMFFSFDIKQYLRQDETLDISEYLAQNYSSIHTVTKKLTNKIRTNKAMASFITNLMNIGKSRNDLNYNCVTIEYIESFEELKEYILFLERMGWTPIIYTVSQYKKDPYDNLTELCRKNAHAVIGQEFSKVVLVMDNNFYYNESGDLSVSESYYSARGMLYQIATRVVDELKIIVINNPKLYVKLLEIKSMKN